MHRFVPPLYLCAALLVVLPLVDFVTNILPFRLADPEWRYGVVGLFSGFVLTPLVGGLLAVGVAAFAGHGSTLRWISVGLVAAAVALLLANIVFVMDVVQVRVRVPPEARSTFDIGWLKALAKHLLTGIAVIWVGVVGVRAARDVAPARKSSADRPRIVMKPAHKGDR